MIHHQVSKRPQKPLLQNIASVTFLLFVSILLKCNKFQVDSPLFFKFWCFFFLWLNANFAKVFQLLLVSCKSYSRSLKLYYNLLLYYVKEVKENGFVDIFWQAVLVKGSMLLNFSWNLRAMKQSFTKYLRQILALIWNSMLCKGFNFCFSGYFYWRWQDFYLGRGTNQ